MMSYLKIVKERIERFDHFSIEQIPRDQNTQADALANLGSAFSDPFLENIPILHLTTPAIEIKEEAQKNEEIYNWSLDVWNYVKHDNLPEDKMEARKTRSKASRYTIFEDHVYVKNYTTRCRKKLVRTVLLKVNVQIVTAAGILLVTVDLDVVGSHRMIYNLRRVRCNDGLQRSWHSTQSRTFSKVDNC
ncbi:hypothetical protein OSB04_028580 [Centaurea solstitialis]|uniref:RNase H type-1 domain-containing protein n=1 Tax=Centaurea solstitialis TaxID=347529 RepID=A0AA38W9E3_9ASTR|nr:hypothetical protein OSB04_028580 [Centaurea solstitialis]